MCSFKLNQPLFKSDNLDVLQRNSQGTQDFFSFKGMFFPDFASYLYNTPHNGSGVLTGDETIGGYQIAGIEYDTYKNKVVRLSG